MGRNALPLPGIGGHGHAKLLLEKRREGGQQAPLTIALRGKERRQEALHLIGHRGQLAPNALGQGSEQGHAARFKKAWHEPIEGLLAQLGQGQARHPHRHPVIPLSRGEAIGQLKRQGPEGERAREVLIGLGIGIGLEQIFPSKEEHALLRALRFPAPVLKAPGVHHPRVDAGVVPGHHGGFGNEQIPASLPGLQLPKFFHQGEVMGEEGSAGFEPPANQALKKKDLPSPLGIDGGIGYEAVFHHGKAVERGPLPHHHLALLPAPVGLLVAPA